jgi:hypothetical protein
MVTVKVNEILNWFHSDYKDDLVQVHTVCGNSIEDCFKCVYALRRSARYDNARRYDFQNADLESKYNKWVSDYETIETYYGSATVD